MPKPFDITAGLAVTAQAGQGRTIIAEIVSYGVVGNTSMGRTIFEPGSIELPAELSRVKFLAMHDQERSVGYLDSFEDSPERLTGAFKIAETPEGDEVLAGVRNKTRDAVSLGVTVNEYAWDDQDNLVVKSAMLNETSIVTIPAFSESRVESIAAARKELKDMPAKPVIPEPVPAVEPVKVEAAAATPEKPAAPKNAPQHIEAAKGDISLSVLASKIANADGSIHGINAALETVNPPLFVKAALTDVVPADDAGLSTSATRPQWFGEIWNARRVARPTVDSVSSEPLTSMKGYGYRRVYPATPLVADYAGSKAPIPTSGKVTTEPADWTAKRKAGGWDIDRVFVDFGDEAFIQMTLSAAYDDYLQQTEAELVAAMLAAGVEATGADVLEMLAGVGSSAATLGSAISKIQFAPDLWSQFVSLNSAEVPWWLRNQGSINLGTVEGNAGNLAFNVNPELPAGQMLAHDRRAVTFRETPLIKVRAENIPNGGIDLGVFGYMSHTINDARAIFVGSATPVVPEG